MTKFNCTVTEELRVKKEVEVELPNNATEKEIQAAALEKAYEKPLIDPFNNHGWTGVELYETHIDIEEIYPEHKPKEYVAIRVWGNYMGSFEYYIAAQQEKAARALAPLNALYEREGKWITADELKEDHPFLKLLQSYTEDENRSGEV